MTIAVIQARMTSTRLPGKVLLPLPFPEGIPLIGYLCNKLKKSKQVQQVVVAIPKGAAQEKLAGYLEENNHDFIEGPEEDVLARFAMATEKYKPDTVIRITADNPFIDMDMLDLCLEKHLMADVDYTVTIGLPYGMNFEMIRAASIAKLQAHPEINDHDREHVTPGFRRIQGMNMQTIQLTEDDLTNIRVTVDTSEDYMRAALLVQLHIEQPQLNDLALVRMAFSKYPFLF